uniref:Exosome component 7 n=1 Tax=Oryctolagus cuniculus TaxID=9986 RepID=A0A5F9DTE0_RABIT
MCRSGNRCGVQHQWVCQGQAGEYWGHSSFPGGDMGRPQGASAEEPLRLLECSLLLGTSKVQAQLREGGPFRSETPFPSSEVTCQVLQGYMSRRGGWWLGAWLPASSEDPSRLCLQGHTDILVGVKAEMGTPKLEKPDEGYVEFFVDCSANATPEFEGRGGDDLGTEIANTLARIFNKGSLDLKSLCISPREHCWVLYVDVLLLECGGNLFDAISIAVKAALFNTRIPRVHVLEDEEGSKEIELSDDPYDCIQLSVENVPCIITLCKIGYRHVVDATLQEEACSLASLLVSVTNKGVVTCMRKVGKGSLDPESIFEMMETGERVGKALHSSLQSLLHKEESLGPKRQKVGFLG